MKTRVHELLGVEPMQRFEVTSNASIWWADHCGILHHESKDGTYGGLGTGAMLPRLINDPSLIIRRPTLTDEQRDTLVWLHKYKYVWLCRSEHGDAGVYACRHKPEFKDGHWCLSLITGVVSGPPVVRLSPLITDWTKPLDIAATLAEGVGA